MPGTTAIPPVEADIFPTEVPPDGLDSTRPPLHIAENARYAILMGHLIGTLQGVLEARTPEADTEELKALKGESDARPSVLGPNNLEPVLEVMRRAKRRNGRS